MIKVETIDEWKLITWCLDLSLQVLTAYDAGQPGASFPSKEKAKERSGFGWATPRQTMSQIMTVLKGLGAKLDQEPL